MVVSVCYDTTMTTPSEYVEDRLGAHTVWQDSQRVIDDLTQEQRTRDGLAASLRSLRAELEVRQALLLDKIVTQHADDTKRPTEAQIERELKADVAKDGMCQQLKADIVTNQNHLDQSEGKVRTMEIRAKALTARMNQLSGILAFYTSCKNAQTEARRQAVGSPATNWPF